MEWVETTGKTVEEAKELALDQLGVDGKDAEFEVLEEPRTGLFGRTRGVARVRARVSPKSPRPKTERRRRSKKSDKGGEGAERAPRERQGNGSKDDDQGGSKGAAQGGGQTGGRGGAKRERPKQERKDAAAAGGSPRTNEEREPMKVDEQIDVVRAFLEQLGAAFGLPVEVEATEEDGDLSVNLVGEGLGTLVGPRLATLDAVQEIVRHVLQRQAEGREYGRVTVDVQGIRARRREALGEYVAEAAARVRDEDVTVVFEVMSSADRKFVHDVVTEIDGVASASEGEDPRRRVVLRRA